MKLIQLKEEIKHYLENCGEKSVSEIFYNIKVDIAIIQLYQALNVLYHEGIVLRRLDDNNNKFYRLQDPNKIKPIEVVKAKLKPTYYYKGKPYGVGRLVHKVIYDYCLDHRPTYNELLQLVPNSVVSGGLLLRYQDAVSRCNKRKRYFINSSDVIPIYDGEVCVSNQITKDTYQNLINDSDLFYVASKKSIKVIYG